MSAPSDACSQGSRERLERVLRFLTRLRDTWITRGAGLTSLEPVEAAINDIESLLQQNADVKP